MWKDGHSSRHTGQVVHTRNYRGGLQGVLGLDFMVNQNGVLDLSKDIIRLNGVAVFMRRGDLRSCAHVCANEDVIIGPGQEAIVWANAERGASLFPKQTGMVEPGCYDYKD